MISIPGSVAAITSVFLGYPFDTTKTRLQTNQYNSAISGLKSTVKTEGVFALYRGVSVPLIMLGFKRGYQFKIFETYKGTYGPWLAGMMAGLSGSIIGCPMQVIKVHMQSTDKILYKNPIECVKDIYTTHGIKGYYQGFRYSVGRDLLFGTFYLGLYDTLKNAFPNNSLGHFFAGGISSSLVWGLCFPIDTFKTNAQTPNGITTVDFLKTRIKTHGIQILWKGVTPALVRIFPVSACSMVMYEWVKKLLGEK